MDWFLYDIGLRHERVKIILMLHCGNEFLKQVLKLDEIVRRYGSAIKSSFLGTVGITFFET